MKYILAVLVSFLLTGCVYSTPSVQRQGVPAESVSFEQIQLNKIESDVAASIETNLEIYYDSSNATSFDYILFVRNAGLQDIVVDVAIQEGGKTLIERTLGVNSFERKSVRGELTFDKPALHIFATKINRINYMGKK